MSINTIQLKQFTKSIIGNAFLVISLLITGIIVGCYNEYRLTLIIIVFVPFVIFITIFRRLALQSDNKKSIQSSMEGGSIISECVTNTKTIFAYNFQPEVIRLYLEAIDYITQRQIRDNFINGLGIGLTHFSNYCKNVALFAGTKRYVLNDSIETEDMAIIAKVVGNCFGKIVDQLKDIGHIKKAIVAFKSIYSTLETHHI